MLYQCSWCGKFIGVKESSANHMTLEMQMQLLTTISHGICHDCKNKVLESIKVQNINNNHCQQEE